MEIGGKWVGYGPGDDDLKVAEIKEFMRDKFSSYAGDLDDSEHFGEDLESAVKEMQDRYGLPVTGIVNYKTQTTMGFIDPPKPDKPTLITLQGTGVDMWTGPPADAARAVEDLAFFQPVAYPAGPFPMWPSIEAGRTEVNRLLIDEHPDGDIWVAAYSQGAIVWALVYMLDMLPKGAPLHHRLGDVKKVVTWGNPCREKGVANGNSFAGWKDLGLNSRGIMSDEHRMKDTPDWWMDFAHEGDLYVDSPDDTQGEWLTTVCMIVMGHYWFESIVEQVQRTVSEPFDEIYAAIEAIVSAGMFFVINRTGPHLDYDIGPAIDYLRS